MLLILDFIHLFKNQVAIVVSLYFNAIVCNFGLFNLQFLSKINFLISIIRLCLFQKNLYLLHQIHDFSLHTSSL